jgi:hypothetical protein
MVLVFIPFGHDAPCRNSRFEISGGLALTAFMPSVEKNVNMIVSAPFYNAISGSNVIGIYRNGIISDGPTDGPRTLAIAGKEGKPENGNIPILFKMNYLGLRDVGIRAHCGKAFKLHNIAFGIDDF